MRAELDALELLAEPYAIETCDHFAARWVDDYPRRKRPGELYALTWPHIDLDAAEIAVIAAYSSRSRETTKPKNGLERTVVLPPKARDALAELPDTGDHVFETLRGKRLSGSTVHWQ